MTIYSHIEHPMGAHREAVHVLCFQGPFADPAARAHAGRVTSGHEPEE
jgi:hypothetical protein